MTPEHNATHSVSTDPRQLYVDLLKKSLMCSLYEDLDGSIWNPRPGLVSKVVTALMPSDLRLVARSDRRKRDKGNDWPALAVTMIGAARLDNLQMCVETTIQDGVPGDYIETGVWRGGACILMRGILAAQGIRDRRVFVADSFRGLPPPDSSRYPTDAGADLHTYSCLAVSRDQVRANFERFGLLDEQVEFLAGWFKDTLPAAPIEKLAVARLDGDLYESTRDALVHLYPRLSPGGFLIVDDYHCFPYCRQAVDDYRATHGISEPIQAIDWAGVYWRRAFP